MTIHNGPGMRTLVLFKGCPLHCKWCSTPESQKSEPEIAFYPDRCTRCGQCITLCPVNAITLADEIIGINRSLCNNCGECTSVCYSEALRILGQPMTVEEILDEVKRDKIFYKHTRGGVTISGGEPLLYPGFTERLIRAFYEENISVGVDTCGHVPWSNIESVLPFVQFFLWDIKHMDPDEHKRLTGVSNDLILKNARSIAERNIPVFIRLPVIPGYNDSEENIKATCEFASGLSSLVEISILPFHHLGQGRYDSLNRIYPMKKIRLYEDVVLQNIKSLVESYKIKCSIVA